MAIIRQFNGNQILTSGDMNTIGDTINNLSNKSTQLNGQIQGLSNLGLYRSPIDGCLYELDDQPINGLPHIDPANVYVAQDVIRYLAVLHKEIQQLKKRVYSNTQLASTLPNAGNVSFGADQKPVKSQSLQNYITLQNNSSVLSIQE